MRVVLPSPSWPASLATHVDRLRLLPDDLRAWIRQAFAVALPPGAKLEIVSEREGTTETGWPLRLVEARFVRDNQVCGVRLGALYAFFEHGGVAMVTASDAAALEPHTEAVVRWLRSARPDFSGELAALSSAWDLTDPQQAPLAVRPKLATRPDPRFGAELRLARLASDDSPGARIERAELELELGRAEAALAELDALPAGELLGLRGRVLAALGRRDEAIRCWRDAAAADPDDTTSRYNLGLALFDAGDFAGARQVWREAAAAAPDDFLILRKIIQAEHRLELWDEAAATRRELRRLWQVTPDPRASLLHEVVIDQVSTDAGRVFVYETYRSRNPSFHPILTFVAVDDHGHDLPHRVVIETSDYAKERGAPFVIVVWHDGAHRVIGTAAELPPYPQIRATALELLRGRLTPPGSRTPSTAEG